MVVSYATYIKKAYFITLIWVQFTVQKYWKMKITGNKVFRVLIETLVILQASHQKKRLHTGLHMYAMMLL